MLSSDLIDFPKLSENQKEEFSGLMSDDLGSIEKKNMKDFLANFCFGTFENLDSYKEKLMLMTPRVRSATMKHLVCMFHEGYSHRQMMVTNRLDWAFEFVCEMVRLPSEVHDGINLSKQARGYILPYFSYLRNGVGEVLTKIAKTLTKLLKKMEVFELSRVRLRQEKTEAVMFLVEMMDLYNVDGNVSEKIMECIKSICEGETGLQGCLEKASGKELVALLGKTEEENRQLLETETLVVRGAQTLNQAIFDSYWNNPGDRSLFRAEMVVYLAGDGICYVELLRHYLNAQIYGKMDGTTQITALLFGLSKSGEDYLLLKITLNQGTHLDGLVVIRSTSEDMCDFARSKVLALESKPALMKF